MSVALADAVLVLVPAATFTPGTGTCQIADRGSGPQITHWDATLGTQPTTAQLAAVTDAQVAAYYTGLQRTAADALLADPAAPNKALRAVLLLALDQLNTLREWCMGLQAGTAGVASLAAFKTMVAGLPALPDITGAAARAAVQSKIDNGAAD